MRTLAVGLGFVAVAAFAQEGGSIALDVGTQKVLTVPGIQRIAVGDSAVADVKTIGNNQILVIGGGEGKTSLIVWKQSGERVSYLITVKGSGELQKEGELSLGRGEIATYKAAGLTKVELGDPAVLEATLSGGQLKLRAKSTGQSDLVAYKGTTEAAHVMVVVVGEKNASLGLAAIELKAGTSATLVIDGVEKATAHDSKLVEASVARPGSVTISAKAAGDVTVELTVRGAPTRLLVKATP